MDEGNGSGHVANSSQGHIETDNNSQSHTTYGQFRVSTWSHMHVFGLWEEVGELGGNQCSYRDNMQTPRRKGPRRGIEPATFSLSNTSFCHVLIQHYDPELVHSTRNPLRDAPQLTYTPSATLSSMTVTFSSLHTRRFRKLMKMPLETSSLFTSYASASTHLGVEWTYSTFTDCLWRVCLPLFSLH